MHEGLEYRIVSHLQFAVMSPSLVLVASKLALSPLIMWSFSLTCSSRLSSCASTKGRTASAHEDRPTHQPEGVAGVSASDVATAAQVPLSICTILVLLSPVAPPRSVRHHTRTTTLTCSVISPTRASICDTVAALLSISHFFCSLVRSRSSFCARARSRRHDSSHDVDSAFTSWRRFKSFSANGGTYAWDLLTRHAPCVRMPSTMC